MDPYQLMNFNKRYQMVIRSTAQYLSQWHMRQFFAGMPAPAMSAIFSSDSEYLQQMNKIDLVL